MHDSRQLLSQSQLKTTPARLAVLNFLEVAKTPLDADTIFVHLKTEHDRADKATIYRMLDTFVTKGLIKRVEFGEGKARYELNGEEHHHLICDRCGRIEDISDCNISELEAEIRQKKNFSVKRHSLEFFGICSLCQS